MSELLLRRRNLLMRKQGELNIRAVCFEADGEQTVSITKVDSAPTIIMQYSYDGVNWDAWDLTPLPFGGSTKVYVRGVNNATFATNKTNNTFTFGTDSYVYVSGIAEALLNGENEVLQYSKEYTFRRLFRGQTALREADRLRFEAMTVLGHSHAAMFENCANLLTGPELPATTLNGVAPYRDMFRNCSSLVNAPDLPATTLSAQCYQNMFYDCTSLKTIRCRAKVTANSATLYWLHGASPSGTFYGHSEYGWAYGVSGIPSGWEFVELTD